ncbi:MAG: kumamolisin [Pirellulaceae bacterium]
MTLQQSFDDKWTGECAMPSENMVPLESSDLPELRDTEKIGNTPGSQKLELTLHIAPQEPKLGAPQTAPPPPALSMEEALSDVGGFGDGLFGDGPFGNVDAAMMQQSRGIADEPAPVPVSADLLAIEKFAADNGLTIVEIDEITGMVHLESTVDQANEAFGVELENRHDKRGDYRGHTGPLQLPASLQGIVETVSGLDDRHYVPRIRPEDDPLLHLPEIPDSIQTYFPTEIAEFYNFPKDLDGAGQTIGIFSIGGQFRHSDMVEFFKLQGLNVPDIEIVQVGRARPRTSSAATIDDIELTLDIQVAGSIAPKAKIVVYQIDPSNPKPFLTGIKTAMFDPRRHPSVISISYGAAEGMYRGTELIAAERAFAAATRAGVTICAAAGDAGSATRDYDQFPPPPSTHVNYPACCPSVLACGGLTLHTKDGVVEREEVWNNLNQCRVAGSGGISTIFARPSYQKNFDIPVNPSRPDFDGRGLPDISANAAVSTGYKTMFHGQMIPNGGTSASTPLIAGLIALLNQGLQRRSGHINPLLYRLAGTDAFQEITEGYNGAYQATKGWNPCSGLGRPHGLNLINALAKLPVELVPPDEDENGEEDDPDGSRNIGVEVPVGTAENARLAAVRATLSAHSALRDAQRARNSL